MRAKRFCSGIVATARREIGRITKSGEYLAVVWWLPLAVTLFFAIFFSQEVVGALPVAVVDEDNTSLSRKVVAMIRATPQTSLVKEMPDMATARNSVLQGKVVAVVEIPNGFSKAILSGQRANVMFYDSGANISTNSLSAKSIQTALTTFDVGVSLQRAEMQGVAPDKAMAKAMPIAFTTYGLFNPWLNYAYYVAPCFWAMIVIIAAMLSTIYAVGRELRYATSIEWLRTANNSLVAALMGKLAPTTLFLWLLTIVIGVVIFGLFGAPMQGSWVVLAMGTIFLIFAYQAIALSIIALTASMRLSLSLGGGYSVLAFTFSGVTFPTMAMFSWVQPFTMLFPYTYFMRLYIDQAVRGSEWWLSMADLAAILLFCILPLLLFGRLKNILTKRKFWGRL
jgi:ABC-2 type transport system permease protein